MADAGEHPDHVVVIKYVPTVADSKRAMDEYISEIFMGGRNTLAIHNTCEDSLLAAPIILDLVLLAELIGRIELKKDGQEAFRGFHPVAVLLSYLTKVRLAQHSLEAHLLKTRVWYNVVEMAVQLCEGST